MLRPIVTLNLPSTIISKLHEKGFFYVEELANLNSKQLKNFNLSRSDIEKQLQPSQELGLDIWQRETQQEHISLCCSELEAALGGGIQCRVITELSGVPFSGKTQICMQLCISVQLNKCYGGLDGRAIYIDTRSGTCASRFKDIVRGLNKSHKDLNLNADEVLKCIEILSPNSVEEFVQIIDSLKFKMKSNKDEKKVRLIIVDSLSMPILCCIDDPTKRPYYYSHILHKLHKLALINELAVVITNELVMQVDKDGKSYFAAAGGQYVADYASVKLEMTRLTDHKFATCLLKSPIMPEISVTFMITEDGIRNFSCT
ncbi:RAD51 homolog C [Nasonia vitripennis]|uniref:DNA repair protein RAD51 homolog 3 n=1 Tax=Nasonia vitripennis TaxID=7425 RepID=A0A7M6UVN9_NASVI|nr:RAD51 homolog C [Nasonia vitripennis]